MNEEVNMNKDGQVEGRSALNSGIDNEPQSKEVCAEHSQQEEFGTQSQEDFVKKQEKIGKQISQIEQSQEDFAKKQEKIGKQISQIEQSQEDFAKKQEKIGKQISQIEQSQEDFAKKQEKIGKQISQIEQSQEVLANKQDEVETHVCGEIKKSQEVLANKQDEVETRVCGEIKKSHESLANKQDEFGKQICSQVEQSIDAVLRKLDETLDKISKVKEENTKLKETIGALESLRNNWEKTEQGLRQQLSDVQMKLHDSEEKKRQQSEDIVVFEARIKERDEIINQNDGKIQELESRVADLDHEIDLKNREGERLKSMQESMSDELESIKEKYQNLGIDDNLLQAFNLYSSLSSDTKSWLYTLFPQQSFLGFVAAGLRLNNISSLWEMTKRNIFNDNLEEVDKLSKLFSILLTVYNEGSQEKIFELIEPAIGSQYNSSTSSIKEVKSSGIVSVVYLVGYKNIRDNIVHKAIISVND